MEINKTRTVPVSGLSDPWPESGFAEPGATFADQDRIYGGSLIFACPGCGRIGSIRVGSPKPPSPGWEIQAGDQLRPETLTLSPSIHCVGCCGWHGYLRSGVFVSC